MSPPSEQLVRDYLNRLSMAAKTTLRPKDRRVLLERVRARIEVECGGVASASQAQVRRALALLGDPVAVAELEQARITGSPDGARRIVATPATAVASTFLRAPAAESDPGPPSDADRPDPDPGVRPTVPRQATSPESLAGGATGAVADEAADKEPAPGEAADNKPAGEHEAGEDGAGEDGAGKEPPGCEPAADDLQSVEEVTDPALVAGLARLSEAARAMARYLSRAGSGALALAVSNPLEFSVVTLLGVGGAAYPPVWLLGVVLALPSRAWDLRDKWTGLAGSLLLVILGTTAVLILGGGRDSPGSYAYEAWLSAGRISRVASLLGAAYLLRRLIRGRREPRQPPWDVPRRRRG